ncbi:hypothetical protein GCM10010441_32460 [Kitasatospora paracochleata]|uniref:Uncharacterized protein n=1 Tax=Kitasatospora paracochleata TaxID=58354 RepID=A0ABT1IPU3_9ACTN|nr:hypothetical protein [Kitasatospora paracochleata]MCP2307142.1 hypothetical protein [Kitasatospora paracochleata]
MSQRRSYSNSGDFNLDDLFRPEPGEAQPGAQQPPVPQQQAAPPVTGQGGPEYWGPPPPGAVPPQAAAPTGEASETQYLPPYPAADPTVGGGMPAPGQTFGGQPGQPYPQQGQSFGGQTFGGQPAPGQTFGGQPGQPYPQQGQSFGGQTFGGQPAPGQTFGGQPYGQPAPPGYAPAEPYQEAAPSRKPDQKLIIGGAIAAVAVVGILVAVLTSGGDGGGSGAKQPVAKASAAQSAPAPAGGAVTPEMKAQAQALSDLLGTASASRQAVVGAVASVGKCENLPDAQAKLTSAATQRQDLLTKLGGLKVDLLPDGAKLTQQLQAAWQASATADSEYAAWAGDASAGCDPAKVKDNPHLKNANDASGQATTAKTQASDLWNAVAGKTGLPTKDKSEL